VSAVDIPAALEVRLNAISPALATHWENDSFEPVNGTPYQRVFLLPATTENPTFGDAQAFETGIFQVTLCYPERKGSGAALARAELIRDQFARGLTLSSGGVSVKISGKASISPGRYEPGLYLIDVSIPYFAYI